MPKQSKRQVSRSAHKFRSPQKKMDTTELQRYAITGSLLAAAYVAWTCPCRDPFLNCHYKEFVALTGAPLLLVLITNNL